MENLSNKINEIRSLIAEIEILDAINRAAKLAESLNLLDFRDEALLLETNQIKINNDIQKNIDDADDLEVRQNKVVDQTLNLLTRMEATATKKIEKEIIPPVELNHKKTTTANRTKSESNSNTILIGIVALVTLVIVGFLLFKIIGNKSTTTTTNQNLPDVNQTALCDDYVARIESAIEAKAFEKAKKGLIAADEVCQNKLKLQFLLEDYNTALLEATQSDENEVEIEPETPEIKPDNNTVPNEEIKPEIIKPGLVQVNPEILNINPKLVINPALLHLDFWTGNWESSFGKLSFVQKGTEVFGDYDNGKGWLQGKYNLKTKLFTGTFYNGISKKYGSFQFKKDGKKFDGKWGWKNEALSRKWSGKLINAKTPTLQFYKTGFSGRVLNEAGQPITRAKVTVNGKIAVFTNAQGFFQILLPEGMYTIEASHANYRTEKSSKKYQLNSNQEKVNFRLRK